MNEQTNMKKLLIVTGLLLTSVISQAQTKPKDGFWRGVFTMAGGQQAPFNFELKSKTAYLINGTERFELPGVYQRADSLFIPASITKSLLRSSTRKWINY